MESNAVYLCKLVNIPFVLILSQSINTIPKHRSFEIQCRIFVNWFFYPHNLSSVVLPCALRELPPFAITPTAALRIHVPSAPRSLQSSHGSGPAHAAICSTASPRSLQSSRGSGLGPARVRSRTGPVLLYCFPHSTPRITHPLPTCNYLRPYNTPRIHSPTP